MAVITMGRHERRSTDFVITTAGRPACRMLLDGAHIRSMTFVTSAWVENDENVAEPLSERDQAILDFERQWWKYAGAKEQAVRDLFEMSATRYYQVLNALIDRPEALVYDPMLVRRLRRLRASRLSRGAPSSRNLMVP
jgi:hypothetical protein